MSERQPLYAHLTVTFDDGSRHVLEANVKRLVLKAENHYNEDVPWWVQRDVKIRGVRLHVEIECRADENDDGAFYHLYTDEPSPGPVIEQIEGAP